MTKYLIFPAPAYGHVNPTLAIAQELVRRGEQVIYYLTEEFQATIEATGATFHPYQSTMGKMDPSARRLSNPTFSGDPNFMIRVMPLIRVKECQQVIPQVLEHIRAEQPDVILYDPMCLWARIVAQILQVPAILLCPTYVSNEHFHFKVYRSLISQSASSGLFEDLQSDLSDLCVLYHIPSLDIRDILTHTEALNIVFMPRAFHPAGETFDSRFLFVGPSISLRQDAPAFSLDRSTSQPTLFISLGTAFNNRPDFFNLCLRAFGNQPWRVVMAYGKKIDVAALDAVPPNFLLAPYVPQLEVLQQTSVFVTHGGMNSTMESLYFGVPMVVVPQMIEQGMTARRCAELGLGVALDPNTLTAETLRAAVEQVHHTPSFRQNVQDMQQTVRSAGGYQCAADAIIEFACSHR
ncbi:MAG TPA: macrolide family glycosyltransferase [Ktedonosporobacter sp.]|nr:macrolide family glycosyltransferase [Ktedonosporobacter sp.]